MSGREAVSMHERWAHLRFLVIGSLLLRPPPKGKLMEALRALAAQSWPHPETGEPVTFSVSTLQRWFHAARGKDNATGVLRRKVRKDLGIQASMSEALQQALRELYSRNTNWSAHLLHKNLKALARKRSDLGPVPSYWTVRRFLEATGMFKRRRLSCRRTEGVERAEERLAEREVRSWEVEYPNGLWHWDGHVGEDLKVLTPRGEYISPTLIGVIDDQSRLACHLQWYYGAERAQILAHTLMQACMKRGLPAGGYHDNGSAMRAAEITQGMARLSIVDAHTMVASPFQNGKCENLWRSVDGQLLAQLQNVRDLTLDQLNEATQAWVEAYNREKHSETGLAPLERFLNSRNVGRDSPGAEALRIAFMRAEWRQQRRSDGTVLVGQRRFELPNAYRHLRHLVVRYAKWDLAHVYLADEHTGEVICRLYPQDKVANSRGVRRPLEPLAINTSNPLAKNPDVSPLLSALLEQQAAMGLPPPLLPLYDDSGEDPDED